METFPYDVQSEQASPDRNILISTFENRSEERRVKDSKVLGKIQISSPSLVEADRDSWMTFFLTTVGGARDDFKYVTVDKTEYIVRLSKGSLTCQAHGGYWTVRASLEIQREA